MVTTNLIPTWDLCFSELSYSVFISVELLYVYINLGIMTMFTEIKWLASFSQWIIFSLLLPRVKLRQLQHWYSGIGDQDIELGQWLIQQDFDNGISQWMTKFWSPKKADILFFRLVFSVTHSLFFILTLTKAYFETRKQILSLVNDVENCVGFRKFIHQIISNI